MGVPNEIEIRQNTLKQTISERCILIVLFKWVLFGIFLTKQKENQLDSQELVQQCDASSSHQRLYKLLNKKNRPLQADMCIFVIKL